MSQFYDLNIQGSEVQLRLDLASHNVLAFDGILDVPVVASEALITEAGTYKIVYAPNGGRGEMLLSMGGVYYRHFKLQSEGKTVLDSSWYNTDGQIRRDRLFLNGAARDIYAYAAGAFGKVERDGVDGITPHIDPVTRHWMIGEADTGILARGTDGESAYELWVEQPGNEGKTLNEFFASLKESGFTSKAVTVLPTGSEISENTIYAVPEKSDQTLTDPDMWAEYIRQGDSWVLMARHNESGLGDLILSFSNLQIELNATKNAVNRKAELKDTEEDGAFFTNEDGDVFMQYNEDGLDASKVSEHFKGLVAPDLSPYPTTEEVEEMIGGSGQSGLVNTEEEGAFFCDENGKVFMQYDNEHGLDVNKVSEHLKGLIAGGGTSYGTMKSLTIPTLSSTMRTLAIPDVKYNSVYSFFGKVSTWGETSELVIQRGNPSYSAFSQAGTVITINSSKIVVNNGGTTTEYTHGLTVSDILMIDIIVSSSVNSTPEIVTNAKIVMNTSSGVYIAEHAGFKGCKDSVTVYVNNGTMTDCVLSWSSSDLNKDIWVFGDSYLSYWNKYIMSFGVNNALFDGFSGRTCRFAINSFNRLVPSLGKPKAIVWAMGMNNGDTDNTVNAEWLSAFQQVEAACASNGIELYVCTIPNALPTVDNSYKNTYIRQSEHKVIDISEILGADTLTNWYSNFRGANGDIHPSVTGAKVIAAKILQCLPTLIK